MIEKSIRSWKRSNQSFSKIDVIDLVLLIFFKDQKDRFDHGQSFLKVEKIERLKVQIPNHAISKEYIYKYLLRYINKCTKIM